MSRGRVAGDRLAEKGLTCPGTWAASSRVSREQFALE
jgi:hypothetical protein